MQRLRGIDGFVGGREQQQRRVSAMSAVRTRDGRRRIWMQFDRTTASMLPGRRMSE